MVLGFFMSSLAAPMFFAGITVGFLLCLILLPTVTSLGAKRMALDPTGPNVVVPIVPTVVTDATEPALEPPTVDEEPQKVTKREQLVNTLSATIGEAESSYAKFRQDIARAHQTLDDYFK